MSDIAAADILLARNRSAFEAFIARARRSLARGDARSAAAFAQMAADLAWFDHTGAFASIALEEVLLEAGRRAAAAAPLASEGVRGRCGPNPGRVLHVLTRAEELGGHTRVVWRWIERDARREHSVALSGGRRRPLPAPLAAAVGRSGGRVHRLAATGPDLLERARRLRALARSADLVVLHVHPFDAVPVLAFADPAGMPPVVLFNHADHVFWTGRSVAGLVLSFRESGARLARERRGVTVPASAVLPLPIDGGAADVPRDDARARLGFPDRGVLMVSMAWAYKFTPAGGIDFVELHRQVLDELPGASIVVIGPGDGPDPRWRAAERATGGRLRAVGPLRDGRLALRAADIYLDSFPFASLTSLLEAAADGTPVASLDPFDGEADVLRSDDPALPPELFRSNGVAAYRARLRELAGEAERRRARGEDLRRRVLEEHGPGDWRRRLEEVYALALAGAGSERPRPDGPLARAPERLDRLLLALHAGGRLARGAHGAVRSHASLLAPCERLRVSVASWVPGLGPCSAWQGIRERCARRARAGGAALRRLAGRLRGRFSAARAPRDGSRTLRAPRGHLRRRSRHRSIAGGR